jgi:hypothetical protein
MVFILIVVVGLVAWALHLMQEAIQSREFSLMLAGFLVSVAAAAMMAVYFLMGHYVGYMTHATPQIAAYESISDSSEGLSWEQWWSEDQIDLQINPSVESKFDTYSST